MSDLSHHDGMLDRIEELEADNRDLALQVMASDGQAQDAYARQLELEAKLAEVETELHMMKTAGVIEVAVRNPSVSEYMAHWEARAEAAEAALVAARETLTKIANEPDNAEPALWAAQALYTVELLNTHTETVEAMLPLAYRAGLEDAEKIADGYNAKATCMSCADTEHILDAIRALPTPTIEKLKEMLKETPND